MKKLLLIATTALAISACTTTSNSPESDQAMVFINTGEIQCELPGKTGIETAQLLTVHDIAVSNTQCGQLSNVGVASVCGGTTVNINVHQIAASDVEKAQSLGFEDVSVLKQKDSLGYSVSDCK